MSSCRHPKCKGQINCLYSDKEIKKQSNIKGSQDQHYITKALIEKWIIDPVKKAIKFFNGNTIEKRNPSYRNVFFYVDEWDRNIEREMNKVIESPVTNKVLTNCGVLTSEQEDKLIAFAFLQSLRKLHEFNPAEAIKLLDGFINDNNYLSKVVDYRFESTLQNINLPEQGMLSILCGSNLIHVLPVSPKKILVLMNKSPFTDFSSIKLDENLLIELSFGTKGQKVVLADNQVTDLEVQKKQLKNTEFYDEQQTHSSEIVDSLILPMIYNSIKETSGVTPSISYCQDELKIFNINKRLYHYVTYFRCRIFNIEDENYTPDQINKMKVEFEELRMNSLINGDRMEVVCRNTIAQIEKISPEEVDNWITTQEKNFNQTTKP